MTEAVIERVDEMSSRVDELEKNIQDLMVQVPPKPVEQLLQIHVIRLQPACSLSLTR